MKHIVKRGKHTQEYDERKLYASIFAAAVAVRVPQQEAELVAKQVCQDVSNWLADKHEVTAGDIHRQAAKHLRAYNPDAGYIYDTHREIS
ncbi:hypothetical protein BRC19_03895 [Candidatus Saccharibacteria bacterium QS_5_54_17]|nr:MAG: hypothetical protein BRC19_03895 [Candidatus Saccharibacteria bacterium QS_5_54_17]